MIEPQIPRPGEFVLDLLLLPGKELVDGGPVVLRFGSTASTSVNLAPRYFRLLHVLATAAIADEHGKDMEEFRGFRSTSTVARDYADHVNHRHQPTDAAVISYVKAIRNAVADALTVVAEKLGMLAVPDLDPIEHGKFGYRVGDISIRILDYRSAVDAATPRSMSPSM
jgi:hypothetical protein